MATLVKLDDHILNLDHVIEAQFWPADFPGGPKDAEDTLYIRLDGVKVDGSALGADELRLHGDKAVRWWRVLCHVSQELVELGAALTLIR